MINRKSRSGSADLSEAQLRLEARGIQLVRLPANCPEELNGALTVHGGGADLVILAGGDGTLNAAAEGLLRCGRPLGILPMGTANDLARTLGIPTDLAGACDVIAQGRTRTIDLGWVNGKHYFN
ncbi:MAG: lipid kinase, partial [Rhodospirillales bacterium]|nr:lipid kinase [Rhodospirillales bacterium]